MLDKQELERLYELHFRTVWNICLTFLKNPADTEDAVHDTFLRLLQQDDTFQSEAHRKAWLICTAKNLCRDELRRHRRQELPLEEAWNGVSDGPYIDETLEAVRSLPERYRAAIYLFYYENLPVEEISRLLDRRENTVRSDLHRGRALLKQMLERSTV